MKTHIKRLTVADAKKCYHLSQSIEWGQTPDDWKRLLAWSGDGAYGMVHRVSILAATTLVFRYGTDRAWIGAVITHPKFQRQGLASQLMETALAELKRLRVREIMLDATPMGQPLYEKSGFRALYPVDIFQGLAAEQPNPDAERYKPEHLNNILKLDTEIFGADRSRILKALLKDFPAWVDYQNGELQGFIIGQPKTDSNGRIGPWIHLQPDGADKLFRTALHHLAGRKIRVDIATSRNPDAGEIAAKYGFDKLRSCTRMILGDVEPNIKHENYYGKTLFATG